MLFRSIGVYGNFAIVQAIPILAGGALSMAHGGRIDPYYFSYGVFFLIPGALAAFALLVPEGSAADGSRHVPSGASSS